MADVHTSMPRRVLEAIRRCQPIRVSAVVRFLAQGDLSAAREVRRALRKLLDDQRVEVVPGSGPRERRVLRVAPPHATPVAPPAAPVASANRVVPRQIEVGPYRPPMPRDIPRNRIPPPALHPAWPAIHTTAVLGPRLTCSGAHHG
ncbi:hypothetical protein ABE488_09140 [Luteimonas sp. TWI662]|uniref:hypothetical protein n=1 Tax=Luteimonas sp. TWI662 TaxID=3136789 RepID=UPI00320B8FFD